VQTRSRMPGCMTYGISTQRPFLLAGVPVHVVAARLGLADPSVTLRSIPASPIYTGG
jgi:hypothetical protein